MRLNDLTGQTFHQLTVLSRAQKPAHLVAEKVWWRCRCTCGNEISLPGGALTSGNNKSCGCLHDALAGARLRTHGLSKLPEYRIWKLMIARCHNPNRPEFRNYGGRGIAVDEEWRRDFTAFYRDMGPRPSSRHSIERRDNALGYSATNCMWALPVEQANNKRTNRLITWNGRTQTLQQWLRELHLNFGTVMGRLQRHWSIDRVFTEPVRPHTIRTRRVKQTG